MRYGLSTYLVHHFGNSLFTVLLVVFSLQIFAQDDNAFEIDHEYTDYIPNVVNSDADDLLNFYFSNDEHEESIIKALDSKISTVPQGCRNLDIRSDTRLDDDDATGSDFDLKPMDNQISYSLGTDITTNNENQKDVDMPTKISKPKINFQVLSFPKSYLLPSQTRNVTPNVNIELSIADTLKNKSTVKKSLTQKHGIRSKYKRHETLLSISTPWVRQFLTRYRRDILLPIPKDYCADNFNLVHLPPIIEQIGNSFHSDEILKNVGLKQQQRFPIFREALRLLTRDDPLPTNISEPVNRAATALYLLLHQRYILSPRGMDTIRRRFLLRSTPSISTSLGLEELANDEQNEYNNVDPIFGRCPTVACRGMPLLPVGDSDNINIVSILSKNTTTSTATELRSANHRAKRYCAMCRQVFFHWESNVDGCAWGTSFCHLFLMVHGTEVFGDWKKQQIPFDDMKQQQSVDSKIFGFRVYPITFK